MAADEAQLRQEADTSILDSSTQSVQYYAQSFHPQSGNVHLYPISAFTRHAKPETMYRVQTGCGRSAILTGDHNLWVLRDGNLTLIETADARTTDYLPLPQQLLAGRSMETLGTLEGLAGKRLFADAQEATLPLAPHRSGPPLIDTLNRGLIPNEPAALSTLLNDLGITSDTPLPEFWPRLPLALIAHLLQCWYDDVATVEPNGSIALADISEPQASHLAYALLSLGIWCQIRRFWELPSGGEHTGRWSYRVDLTGGAALYRFRETIGFSDPSKRQALEEQLPTAEMLDSEPVPIRGDQLRLLRLQLALPLDEVATQSGVPAVTIGLIESGQVEPKHGTLFSLLRVLQQAADAQHPGETWWAAWQTLSNLSQLRWTSVLAAEPVAYHDPYVYDLSVPGVETFLGGMGGFFVHNTFTIAHLIEQVQRPTLVMAHNKTLAAQLYSEFKEFFPNNSVEYFVSYYDYYQPEAYVPQHDLFIEKDSSINDEINRLRLAATQALFSREDVIIIASVSAIYGLGSPEDYGRVVINLKRGEVRKRDKILRHLIDIHYERNDYDLKRGTFRVRGDTLEVIPAYEEAVYRVEFWGDDIERITEVDSLTGEIIREHVALDIYPAKHFITPEDKLLDAIASIEAELQERLAELRANEKLLEAQRLEQRTMYDLEMLREIGHCSGVENYSRHLSQRPPGSTPWTLLDYFPDNFLMVIDESHMTLPQVRGMFNGDRARKETLVEYGFRLPSALDNRPLKFDEFMEHIHQTIYVSATPSVYEREHSDKIVQQVIRPTGVVDPVIILRPSKGQVDDLLGEINKRIKKGERVLVTTLTKRMSEDLADYLADMGVKVHYLHSEIQTIERVEILRELRLGIYDVVVGINLLREGLDLPEVSLVAILDADKEGFLRSDSALIQTIGRAARHVEGTVIMYADRITDSMQRALDETDRRRAVQEAHNKAHGIEPYSISKAVKDLTDRVRVAEAKEEYQANSLATAPRDELVRMMEELTQQMRTAAQSLEFERAALLRDQINDLRVVLEADDTRPEWEKIREQQVKESRGRSRKGVKYET
ncbi:MAG: excinuclease ABC subunit UvrB [Ardenticatenales bacterium]|nr:excinuclease ABC subunit UvrB [Ardenticatenales bacterium]